MRLVAGEQQLFLLTRVLIVLPLWVTFLWQLAKPGRKVVTFAVASSSTSEKQKPLSRAWEREREISWQEGQHISEMELRQLSGCLLGVGLDQLSSVKGEAG